MNARFVVAAIWVARIWAGLLCVAFYFDDNTSKAIFWLLVTAVVVKWTQPWTRTARDEHGRIAWSPSYILSSPKPWRCEYCGELTTMPHRRCQELRAARPRFRD